MNYNELDKFEICGGNKLEGTIKVQTSKNATLPIITASIMAKGVTQIIDCPDIIDVHNMLDILKGMGAHIQWNGDNCFVNTKRIENEKINSDLCKTMRSSVFLLGPLLARFKTAKIVRPGGCKIGARPIDIHINAFKCLGVEIEECGEYIIFNATKAKANRIKLKLPSVGATENIVQFASTLKGKTIIHNAAREPEIVDLCNYLSLMGAKILGAGTNKITIYGVDRLKSVVYKPISDRIVAGTLMIATAMCGGNVTLQNVRPEHNENLIDKLVKIGCQIKAKDDIINISSSGQLVNLKTISTGYYPKFPTDLQSQMLALSCISQGKCKIKENVFENRFLIVSELRKMGAKIDIVNNKFALIEPCKLKGTEIIATDLRGGASLVLAGLVAEGTTLIDNVKFIDRGYVNFENMLTSLGANIKRI